MTIENAIRVMAGFMVLLSVGLSVYVHPYAIGLAIFVALNLIQSAFTGICPAVAIFKKLGLKEASGGCCTSGKD